MTTDPILTVEGLTTTFTVKRGGKTRRVAAVKDVSFTLAPGEILGIVGETGCGKTTVGRSIIRLVKPEKGEVIFAGVDVQKLSESKLRSIRLGIRMVFQDPYASLNPRRMVGDSVAEAGDIHGIFKDKHDRAEQVAKTLTDVGLDPSFAERFPHELSGGQRQRVGIARAILPSPDVIIADEPVSALDVSVQAQVLNLLADLQEKMGLAILFISHDLAVVGQISDRVAVMYMGGILEMAPTREIFANPKHPYTIALMAAVPKPDPAVRIKGMTDVSEPPSRFDEPKGCPYMQRCPIASEQCASSMPPLRVGEDSGLVACHNV
ncbi:MAG: ABC transporter ATP-binding protein [Alphaproteobacteria bacterium]